MTTPTNQLKPIRTVHEYFELSYSQYLTIPRSILQSMPDDWQNRFVECLDELDERYDWKPVTGRYWVRLKDDKGKFVHDPLMNYDRGRRYVAPFSWNARKEQA